MPTSLKISRLDSFRVLGTALPFPQRVAPPANPKQYRVSDAITEKMKPKLELRLSLQCQTTQILDPDFEE
jgi:hypothetical protein